MIRARPAAHFLHADARALPLAEQSVQCVITSPPYYGLRDYGLPPSVWGGEAGCSHAWGDSGVTRTGRNDTGRQFFPGHAGNYKEIGPTSADIHTGAFCLRCSAWRGTLGLEPTPALYVQHLVEVFREVRRVLRDDGTCWLNLGDSYATGGGRSVGRNDSGLEILGRAVSSKTNGATGRATPIGFKPKDLIGIPWRVAFALQADGWYLRSDIIWAKPNPMPESVEDRPTKAHEYLFLLAKREWYFYDAEAIKEPLAPQTLTDRRQTDPAYEEIRIRNRGGRVDGFTSGSGLLKASGSGRNRRSVWTIATEPYPEAHFATFPPDLVKPCVLAGTSERGACARCGTPWARVVERDKHPERDMETQRALAAARTGRTDGQVPGPSGMVDQTRTAGWRPTCSCTLNGEPYPTRPCVVLDPFSGAGTVAHVAKEFGRVGIGVELKPAYIAMAEERTRQEVLPL